MPETADNEASEHETLSHWGRRLVRASEDLPREALQFLGRPMLGSQRRPPQGAVPGEMSVPTDAP